jgi:prevent-host-death family protein
MIKVGSYEAKTHLPKLLEKASKGERITITKHGVPLALLTPASPARKKAVSRTIIEELHKFRKNHTLGNVSLREAISEGRR